MRIFWVLFIPFVVAAGEKRIVRIRDSDLAKHEDAVGPFWPTLITWAGEIPVNLPEAAHT